MIYINPSYIDKFKKHKESYVYQIDKGLFLAFDINDLSYIGYEIYYSAPNTYIARKEQEAIQDLLNRNILDIRED